MIGAEQKYMMNHFINLHILSIKRERYINYKKRNYKLKTYETIEDSTLIDNAMFITYNKISYFDIKNKKCELCYKCAKKIQ